MLDRHNRRAACNTITEKPLLEYGGINNIYSPFNILNTKVSFCKFVRQTIC